MGVARPSAIGRGTRLESLTGLRFLAALLVFAYHVGGVGAGAGAGWGTPGRSGVSFFFILSGFLLAYTARPGDTARQFYRRRVARIVPAYLVALILVLASAAMLGARFAGVDLVPFTLLQSWVPSRKVFFAGSPVFWSLSTEAFFYLVFPFVYPRFARLRTRGRLVGMAVAVAAAVGIAIALAPLAGPDLVEWSYYIFPPVRFLEFALGMLLGLQLRFGRAPEFPLPVAVLLAVLGYALATVLPVTLTAVGATVVPYALLIWSAAWADVHGRSSPFRHRIPVTLGLWSYSFYLLHLRVIQIVGAVARKLGIDVDHVGGLGLAALIGLMLVLSVAASGLLYRLVEMPGEARLRRAGAPRH